MKKLFPLFVIYCCGFIAFSQNGSVPINSISFEPIPYDGAVIDSIPTDSIPVDSIPMDTIQTLTQNLICYWPFNGDAYDYSGNNINGVVYGATATEDRFGNYNAALEFNGIDNYVRVNDTSLLNPEEITICLWYKPTEFKGVGNNSIIDKPYNNYEYPYYQYHIGVSGNYIETAHYKFHGDVSVNGQRVISETKNDLWKAGQWYFICYTKDKNTINFYVNDSLMDVSEAVGPIDAYGQDLFIGKLGNHAIYTPGVIDDVRLFNKALSKKRISELYSELICGDKILKDTIRYKVCDPTFEAVGLKTYMVNVDSFKTVGCGMDSIVYYYETYEFEAAYFTDSISVIDSFIVQVYDTVQSSRLIITEIQITGLEDLFSESQISVFPNPSSEYFFIRNERSTINEINIYNIEGQLIFLNTPESKEAKININELEGYGTYIMVVKTNEREITLKVLVK